MLSGAGWRPAEKKDKICCSTATPQLPPFGCSAPKEQAEGEFCFFLEPAYLTKMLLLLSYFYIRLIMVYKIWLIAPLSSTILLSSFYSSLHRSQRVRSTPPSLSQRGGGAKHPYPKGVAKLGGEVLSRVRNRGKI